MTRTAQDTPEVVTFGCRLNAYESEVMKSLAQSAGEGDKIFVNTCAVTKEAERQARQTVRRLARENLGREITVTGCAAQIDPQNWAELPGVTKVMGNLEKLDPAAYGLCRVRKSMSPTSCRQPKPRPTWSRVLMDGPVPSCRCSRAAITAARSASSPMAGEQPFRAARRDRTAGADPGRKRVS